MIRAKQVQRIELLIKEGKTVREIAQIEEVAPSTVMKVRKSMEDAPDARLIQDAVKQQILMMTEAGHSQVGIAKLLKVSIKTVRKVQKES